MKRSTADANQLVAKAVADKDTVRCCFMIYCAAHTAKETCECKRDLRIRLCA